MDPAGPSPVARATPAPRCDEDAADRALFEVDRAPVDELLRHVSDELRRLCSAAHEIEAIVAPLITDRGERGFRSLQGLQEMDRLIQHIEGLADYLGGLAEASQGLGTVDAGAARRLVKVARLAQGLAGRLPPDPPRGADDDVEFL
jgi:hypothetical protein